MPYLKYYAEERKRQPELAVAECSITEVERAIKKLSRHFKERLPAIRYTRGNRYSRASYGTWYDTLTFNTDHLTWLLVAHEFAHVMIHKINGRGHCKQHARAVDRVCRYIVKKGWDKGALIPEFKPPKPEPTKDELRAKKIKTRRKQIARLETKIKRSTTALKKARRSLAALERAQVKATAASVSDGSLGESLPDDRRPGSEGTR